MAQENKGNAQGFEFHFDRLEQLSAQLQNNEVSIDELIPRMKQALDSIKACKDVLKKTKFQLEEIKAEFEEIQDPKQSQE